MRRGKRPFATGTANEAGNMEPNITKQEMRLDKVIILSFPDSTPKQENRVYNVFQRTMCPAKDGKDTKRGERKVKV